MKVAYMGLHQQGHARPAAAGGGASVWCLRTDSRRDGGSTAGRVGYGVLVVLLVRHGSHHPMVHPGENLFTALMVA